MLRFKSHSSIYNHFSDLASAGLLQWDWGKCGTLRPGPRVAIVRYRGMAVDVGMIDTEFKANVDQD